MADTTPMDNFEIQQENDFEKISAPGSASDQEGDGLLPPADAPQVSEVSTTTDGKQGEIDTDDDQFNMIGASDVEGFIAEPLVSLDNTNQSQFQPDTEKAVVDDLLAGVGEIPPHSQPDILAFDNNEIDMLSSPELIDSLDNDVDIQQNSEAGETPLTEQVRSEVEENLFSQSEFNDSEAEPQTIGGALLDGDNGLVSETQVGGDESQVESLQKADDLDVKGIETLDSLSTSIEPEPEIDYGIQPEPKIDYGTPSEREIDYGTLEPETIAQSYEPELESVSQALEEETDNVEPITNFDTDSSPAALVDLAPPVLAAPLNIIQNEPDSTDPIEDLIQQSQSDKELDSEADQVKQEVSEQSSQLSEENSTEGNWLKGVDPRVVELIYWRDVKKTGVVFGTMLAVMLSLAIFSLVSVLAYLSLALLTVSFSFVVYKKIMGAVQKSTDGHPFNDMYFHYLRCVLDMDLALKEDKLKSVIQALLANLNKTVSELRRLFFIEDMVDSIKFGLLLWVSTYLGCCLNGITLVILAVISLFTLPKVYETYQVQIDNYVGLARAQVNNVMTTVTNKLPFLKKKEKAN